MGMILYGTRVFTKQEGYFGEKEECTVCKRVYQKAYVRYKVWAHLNYIPLFPIKKTYFKMCPICGNGQEIKSKEAKAEMLNTKETSDQNLEVYAKHILANKPKGILSTDTSYELWVKDLSTGEEICVDTDLYKDAVKDIKKERGLKKLEIRNV